MHRVRPATAADAAAIAAIYAPYVADTAISFELVAPDASEMATRMNAGSRRLPWLVAEASTEPSDRAVPDAGPLIGFAYAAPFRHRAAYQWSVEVSLYVTAEAQRQGVGRDLYLELLAELRGLGYVMAFAGIALPNPGSVGLHEALGFTPIGSYPQAGYKHGRWHDVGWWSLALADPAPKHPTAPRAWGD